MLDLVFPELRLLCLWLLMPCHPLLLDLLEVLMAFESVPPVDLESMVLLQCPPNDIFLNSSAIFLLENTVLDWIRVGISLLYYIESSST